jgi:ribosome-binding protein aMBF1 (putative translation factor)
MKRCAWGIPMSDAKGRWAEIRERRLNSPALREQYENTKQELILTRQMLMQIDEHRVEAGLSKADLARAIEANPATIRRIFTTATANPSMRTVFRMLDALGMDIEIKQARPPKAGLFSRSTEAKTTPKRRPAVRVGAKT